MSEILYVVIDLNFDKLAQSNTVGVDITPSPLQILFDSLIKFVNAFQLQSATNKYRIYAALFGQSQLIFPQEELGDNNLMQKFAFEQVREAIYERIFNIIDTDDNQSNY